RAKGHTAFNVSAQPNLALDHNQGPGLVLGKEIGGKHDVVVSVSLGSERAAEAELPAEARQALADFSRKNDNQREYGVRQEVADEPVQGHQLADAGEIQPQRNGSDTNQHQRCPRASNEREGFVNDNRDQDDVDNADQADARPWGAGKNHSILTRVVKSQVWLIVIQYAEPISWAGINRAKSFEVRVIELSSFA